MKTVYEILHYKAVDVTIQSVDSVLSIADKESLIVVVDNASPDNSWGTLSERYANNERIHLIKSETNLGFAGGNNLGYSYAKTKLNADIIVCMNNDVIIYQQNFETALVEIIKLSNAAVVAPAIINLINENQNPLRLQPLSTIELISFLVKQIVIYCIIKSKLGYSYLKEKLSKKNHKRFLRVNEAEIYGIVPHGACVIFTPLYVSTFDDAFVPVTFLYGEEDLLFDRLKRFGLNCMYTNRLRVNHMEKISTTNSVQNDASRDLFQTKNRIRSTIQRIKYRFNII